MTKAQELMAVAVLAAASVWSGGTNAGLTLTPYGVTEGFNLSLFANQLYRCCVGVGPAGIATNSLGQVVLQQYDVGLNYVFNDVDLPQTPATALSSAPWLSSLFPSAIANSGGTLYATNYDAGKRIAKLNPDGSFNSWLTGIGFGYGGIATNPVTGHLLSAGANGSIFDTDPVTGISTLIVTGPGFNFFDGISVSSDGKTIYAAANDGHVHGYNYSGVQVYNSGLIAGGPDGTGVIGGSNKFAGDIIANANDGTVWLLNPSGGNLPDLFVSEAIIASGGTRGDYAGIDKTNGSLLLTQTSEVYRLTCGPNCSFASVPEPATLALLVSALAGLGSSRRRQSN